MTVSRRAFLKTSGSLGLWCSLPPLGLELETVSRGRKTLVVLFLRGGADGLNLVVPHGDPGYYAHRHWLAVPRPGAENGALDLDGTFGLHPWAEPLLPFFESGVGAAVHAVGHGGNTRSHFEEQDVWETGRTDSTLHTDGWLNRHLALTDGAPIRAVSIGDSLPRLLRGDAEALALRGLDDLSLPDGGRADATLAALARAYGVEEQDRARTLLASSGRSALAALRDLQAVASVPYEPKVAYPDTQLGRRMREAARLVRADVGVEVLEVDFGGWDTHQNQGAVPGPYAQLVRQLSDAVGAFLGDLEDRLDDLLVLAFSEFGRTADLNGTGGTDHGWGNCVLAFGGPVARAAGGKPRPVLGRWPGLAREQLNQGRDLAHTTDFRDVFGEVARVHLANPNPSALFPGRELEPVGLVAR